MSNEVLIDLLEKVEITLERSEERNAVIINQASQLFKRVEQRLNQPLPAPDTRELNELGQRSFGAIQQVAGQMETELAALKPAERVSKLKRWQVGAMALITLLSLLSAFVGGVFASVSHPIFSKAILPYAQDTGTCEGLGGWVQPAGNGQGRLCVIRIN
ncbi:hypothetical protein [Ruegeria lacuscaerulensis]|uniref:hypothetical protein n=1 Tax=Ruegeria lacuscaerulensis TaxID=55218 RepID=UPI00147FE106|nr:hypothetical protein [Ruegeria lacuscaerulensis]